MTTAGLRDSVSSLSAADRATAVLQLAKLVERQSRILGEPIPDLVLRVLNREDPAASRALSGRRFEYRSICSQRI